MIRLPSIPRTALIVMGVSLLVAFAVWSTFTSPRRSDVAFQRTQVAEREQEVAANRAVVDSYLTDSEQFEQDMETIRQAELQVGFVEADDPLEELALILPSTMVRAFESVGVELLDMSTATPHQVPNRSGSVRAVKVNVRITGTVDDLRRGMNELASNGLPVTLWSGTVSTPRSGSGCPVEAISATGCLPISATLLVWYSTARPLLTADAS